jgi:hypothetical protein
MPSSDLAPAGCGLYRNRDRKGSYFQIDVLRPSRVHRSEGVGMSAMGRNGHCAIADQMSALPPKADIAEGRQHVRFVPIADMPELDM